MTKEEFFRRLHLLKIGEVAYISIEMKQDGLYYKDEKIE
jgi:hypothetical protein